MVCYIRLWRPFSLNTDIKPPHAALRGSLPSFPFYPVSLGSTALRARFWFCPSNASLLFLRRPFFPVPISSFATDSVSASTRTSSWSSVSSKHTLDESNMGNAFLAGSPGSLPFLLVGSPTRRWNAQRLRDGEVEQARFCFFHSRYQLSNQGVAELWRRQCGGRVRLIPTGCENGLSVLGSSATCLTHKRCCTRSPVTVILRFRPVSCATLCVCSVLQGFPQRFGRYLSPSHMEILMSDFV